MRHLWRAIQWFSDNVDTLVALIIALVASVFGYLGQLPTGLTASITLGVLGVLAFGTIRDRRNADKLEQTLTKTEASIAKMETAINSVLHADKLLGDRVSTGLEQVFPNTENFDNYWLEQYAKAHDIVVIMLRMRVENDSFQRAYEDILRRGGSVTLVVNNPLTVATWLRYKEERLKLPTAERLRFRRWTRGLEEIADGLRNLHDWRESLQQRGTDVSKLSIKVFPYYPSAAFNKIDNRIYFHAYPFVHRGFKAPEFMFGNPDTDTHHFLEECITFILEASDDLDTVIGNITVASKEGKLRDDIVDKAHLEHVFADS